jgi:hypothetical protein
MGVAYTRGWLKTHEKKQERMWKRVLDKTIQTLKNRTSLSDLSWCLKVSRNPDSTAALCHNLADFIRLMELSLQVCRQHVTSQSGISTFVRESYVKKNKLTKSIHNKVVMSFTQLRKTALIIFNNKNNKNNNPPPLIWIIQFVISHIAQPISHSVKKSAGLLQFEDVFGSIAFQKNFQSINFVKHTLL